MSFEVAVIAYLLVLVVAAICAGTRGVFKVLRSTVIVGGVIVVVCAASALYYLNTGVHA